MEIENVVQADVVLDPIPFDDSFFDGISAFDFIERIPRVLYAPRLRFPLVELMNEIHRVLKPGGLFLHSTPAFPSKQAFQDPTHVNIITEDTIPLYFCEPNNWAKELGYGFHGSFELVEQKWVRNKKLAAILRAIK